MKIANSHVQTGATRCSECGNGVVDARRRRLAPGLAPDNGKTPADEVAEAGEVHSAHALGSTTTPHSKREMAAWQLVATNSMGSASNSMGKTPGGSGGEEGESDEGAGSMRSTHAHTAWRRSARPWGSGAHGRSTLLRPCHGCSRQTAGAAFQRQMRERRERQPARVQRVSCCGTREKCFMSEV